MAGFRLAPGCPEWYDTEVEILKKRHMIMEIYLIGLAVALVGGLLMSRVSKLLHLPAVTAYLVAGLLLRPFFLGRLNWASIPLTR